MNKVISIIPARKGSKGIPGKCLYRLSGKELVLYTIEASMASTFIDESVVTTDCEQVKKIARSHNLKVIDRPGYLAADDVRSDLVVKHVIDMLSLDDLDVIVFLQPTSPLRNSGDINACVEKMRKNESCVGVYSVSEPTTLPLKAFKRDERGYLKGLYGSEFPFMRRQDLPECFFSNGAIYSFYVGAFRKAGYSFNIDKVLSYCMPDDRSVDIDSVEDIKYAERKIMEKKNVSI